MNEPENNLQNSSRLTDMSENYEALRRQFNLVFIGLVVTSFTLTVFLGLQAKRSAAELSVIKPRAEETAKVVQQNDANVQALFAKLTEFGRTHPDFQLKILSKYRIDTNAPGTAPKK